MSLAYKLAATTVLAVAGNAASATSCVDAQKKPVACPAVPPATNYPSSTTTAPINNTVNPTAISQSGAIAGAVSGSTSGVVLENGAIAPTANAAGGTGIGGAGGTGVGGAGGNGTGTGGNAVNGGITITNPRNAPSMSPSSVGAGVFDCYDKNGISFVLSTAFEWAGVGVTYSFDAKEIPGCFDKQNRKAAGITALQSNDGGRFSFGATVLGLTKELETAASPEGQRQARLFDVKSSGNSAPAAAPVTVAIYNQQPAAPATTKVIACHYLKNGKPTKGEWMEVDGVPVCGKGGDSFAPKVK